MGNKVIIYDSGQVYEIDSDLIYVPVFGLRSGKTLIATELMEQAKENGLTTLVVGGDKNDTESEKENKD